MIVQAGAEVAGAYQDPGAALDAVRADPPDAVFLDVEMPGMNGMELARHICELDADVQIVFVTAYEQYAIGAFELSAVYYVLKPITPERILKAVRRVERVRQMRRPAGGAEAPALIGRSAEGAGKLSVKVRDDIVLMKLEDILFVMSENGKTVLATKGGSYTSTVGMKVWEEKLKSADFIRCHRCYLVNTAYIRKMIRILGEYRELVLDYCDVNIPVSRQRIGELKRWMGVQ